MIKKQTEYLNSTVNQLIQQTSIENYQTTLEYTFFICSHELSSNIDHVLGQNHPQYV